MTGFGMLAGGLGAGGARSGAGRPGGHPGVAGPLLFFFDGFRTSHEENKIDLIPDEQIREMIDDRLVRAHRARALSPEHPVVRGTAHNPDTFFQAREAANPFHAALPAIVQKAMDRLGALTGRRYQTFRYQGHPQPDRVVVAIGSACEVLEQTAEWLNRKQEKVGVLRVVLYRPWDAAAFLAALPRSVQSIAVLDRTKEVGATGEPLYLDVVTTCAAALAQGTLTRMPRLVGGRYGLSSKDFNPSMAKAVFDALRQPEAKQGFTVGIVDDVSGTSLNVESGLDIEPPDVSRALFYGLGADGTVGANKNTATILAASPGVRPGTSSTTPEVRLLPPSPTCASARGRSRRLPPRVRQLHRGAQVRLRLQDGRPRLGGTRGHGAPQLSLPTRPGLGRAPAGGAAADRRPEAPPLRDRRLEGRLVARARFENQHHSPDLLPRPVRGDAA